MLIADISKPMTFAPHQPVFPIRSATAAAFARSEPDRGAAMNILLTNYRDRNHPQAGGAENHLHSIFSRIVDAGHDVHLLTTSYPGAGPADELDGIRIVREGSDLTFNVHVAARLPGLVRRLDIDVVVEDLNKIPVFAPLRSQVPVVVQTHHLWKSSVFRNADPVSAALVYALERAIPAVYRRQRFIAVSPSTRGELVDLGIAPDRIEVIYNGSDPVPWEPVDDDPAAPYFLWLGRLQRYKGVRLAVEAFARLLRVCPDLELHIAGDGPGRDELQRLIVRKRLDHRIRLWGRVDESCKRALLRGATAVLQTSVKEGWGLTVIEANACGTPAIASCVAGLRDSVIHEYTGLLFTAGNPDALAECMLRISQDHGLRARLAGNARSFARRFDWDVAAERTLEVLWSAVEGRCRHAVPV